MTPEDARTLILTAIADVAPDVDTGTVDAEVPLQEQLDLDSMDFQAILGEVAEEAGIDIPERDYPQLETLAGAVDYVAGATG